MSTVFAQRNVSAPQGLTIRWAVESVRHSPSLEKDGVFQISRRYRFGPSRIEQKGERRMGQLWNR